MSVYVIDVESDGPASGLFSMVSFGAVRLDRELDTTFYAKVAPLFERFDPEALAISGTTREQHLSYPQAEGEIRRFAQWVKQTNIGAAPKLISDNPAFDWQWINWYCHSYLGENPFGHSARRVGDFCAGLETSWEATGVYRALGKTPHTHHPVNDAKRVAEGLIAMADASLIQLPGVASDATLIARPASATVPREDYDRLLAMCQDLQSQLIEKSALIERDKPKIARPASSSKF